MRIFIVFSILLLTYYPGSRLFAKEKDLETAQFYYHQLAFYEAIPYYEKVATQVNRWEVYAELADCYRLTGNFRKAIEWYGKAANMKNCADEVKLNYAKILMQLQQYDFAKDWLEAYHKRHEADKRVINMIAGCGTAAEIMNGVPDGTARLLGFNTNVSEFAPARWKGNVVFTADTAIDVKKKTDNWTGKPFYNIYSISCDDSGSCGNTFGSVSATKDMNIKYHDGPCTFSANGDEMYFTRSRYSNNFLNKKALPNKDSVVLLEVMVASDYDTRTGEFKKVVPFQYNSKEYSVAHVTVSPNGNLLVFSSNMTGGWGGTDLYMCRRGVNREWLKPVNMGKIINTEGDELFPHFADERTLYFSSDGHVGLGGLDIYVSRWNDRAAAFAAPENVGIPLNSSYDEMSAALYADGRSAYFSSNRPSSKGSDNIYFFKRKKVYLQINVTDSITKRPLRKALIKLQSGKETISERADNAGKLFRQVFPEMPYNVTVSDSGYIAKSVEVLVNTRGNKEVDTITENVALLQTGYGVVLVVKVTDPELQPIAAANITLKSANDYRNSTAENNGVLVTRINADERYSLEVGKIEYQTAYLSITPGIRKNANDTIFENVVLYKIKGRTLDVGVIPFEFNQYTLNDIARERLNVLLDYLKVQHPRMRIQLRAHTDCRGSYQYNMELSNKRAKSVRQYLIDNNIAASRLETKGVGYNEPKIVCSNCQLPNGAPKPEDKTKNGAGKECSEEEHYQNRTLGFIILKDK